MKELLARFEKLAAAHQLNADCAAAMRGLLQDAHTAGYSAHMAIAAEAADANEDEQDSLPGAAAGREAEPEDDKPEDDERMARVVRKAVRKEVRKALRTQKKSVRKEMRKLVNQIAATHPGAAALMG